ncbi:AAA family ATPase [Mesorhizobium mediterraneum]|uniref:AAA family ATPase n=1 Tax=Mesorhizobium mediterraneum TaxID=43617 RepID=UPI001781ED57|nr:AAA family ATPase [Mesorhizobium mediterraneum]
MTATEAEPNPLLDLINEGDVERLGDFFYTSAAKAKGIVKVRPEGVDWTDYTFKRELLQPAETDPADIDEAMRWCVIVDDIPECDAETAGYMYLDRETGAIMIGALCGPAHDHDVAIRMIARDLQAEQSDGLPRSKSADRIRRKRKTIKLDYSPPKVDNDNRPKSRFRMTWFDDIADSRPKHSLINGMLGEGEFTMVSGMPGSGKSVIMTDAACHVAAGREWHGRKVKQGLVIYVAAERQALTERRMLAFRKVHGVKDVPLLVLGGMIDLTTGLADADALATAINDAGKACGEPCVWIIIDTLTRTFGPGDQHQSKDMAKFVRSCDRLSEKTKAHVTVIHHTGWAGDRGKGAIDLDGAVDASFMVKKSASGYALECDGANDGDEGTICHFTMKGIEVGIDDEGEPTYAPVVMPSDGVSAGEHLVATLKGHSAKALEVLTLACQNAGRPIGEEDWRKAFYSTDPSAKAGTLKTRFKRARETLTEQGVVHYHEGTYWVAPDGTNDTCAADVPCTDSNLAPYSSGTNGTHPLGCADVPSDVPLKNEDVRPEFTDDGISSLPETRRRMSASNADFIDQPSAEENVPVQTEGTWE